MKHKLLGTVAIASLGAALAFAVPADARPGHGGGGGGGGGGRAMGHASAPMAHSGPSFSGGSQMNSQRFTAGNTARFSGRPSNNFAGNNFARSNNNFTTNRSFARANSNWSSRGNWRHHHRGGAFAAGIGLGLAYGAYGYGGCDSYDYDCGYGYGYGPSYAYDEGYDDSYAAAPEYTGASVQYCMQRFRSYDIASQTYLGTDGLRHSCP